MSQYGPQEFEIQLSDSFSTLNPADPLLGITVTALVGVTVPWNLARTDLAPRSDLGEKGVTFAATKWQGAGPGPHDVYEKKIDEQCEKIGTIFWSINTEFYKIVQTSGDKFRWLVTPCPLLLRTFTPEGGAPQTTEVMKQPVPCPGNWATLPQEVQQSVNQSLEYTAQLAQDLPAPVRHTLIASPQK